MSVSISIADAESGSSVRTKLNTLIDLIQAVDFDTLAELNAILTDATLIDTTDSRLSDARIPTAHTHPRETTLYVIDFSTALETGDGKAYFRITPELDGRELVTAEAQLGAAQSTSGTPTVQIARMRAATAGGARTVVDMLSTAITIDANEWDSKDATTPAVVNAANDDVAEGDLIRIDVDDAGTGAQGLFISLGFD